MGVYIEGMEMPTNADMAPTAVWVYPNGYAIVFKDNGRMKQYTQAVPVPPHGRLIDADTVFNNLERTGWYDNADRDIAEDLVLDAPTIIGEEEAESCLF